MQVTLEARGEVLTQPLKKKPGLRNGSISSRKMHRWTYGFRSVVVSEFDTADTKKVTAKNLLCVDGTKVKHEKATKNIAIWNIPPDFWMVICLWIVICL